MSTSVFVGLDYHKCGVQVCVLDASGGLLMNQRCANDWREIAGVVQQRVPGARVFAAIEACAGAADLAGELIDRAGWSVDLAHPGYVARIKQSPDKSDFSDARLLADLERVGYLPKVWLAPAEIRELRRLVRYRQQLANERRNVKLRVSALLRDLRVSVVLKKWTRAWLQWLWTFDELPEESRWIIDQHLVRLEQLNEQIKLTEQRLAERTAEDPVVQKLLELKGVGLVTAVTLRAEIGRFDRFRTGKQLSRFCGLSPRNASSGERQADAGLIKAGNRELRRVLIETAHRLARYDLKWNRLNIKLRLAGKAGSVAAAAIANRWVRWLYHQMKELAA